MKVLLFSMLAVLSVAVVQAGESFSGAFEKKSKSVSGNWIIEKDDQGWFLKVDSSFKAKNGPDLKFFLSPIAFAKTNGKNAAQGGLFIGDLKATKGEQVYRLPSGIDFAAYQSVLLHCEKYSVLWGGSPLVSKN